MKKYWAITAFLFILLRMQLLFLNYLSFSYPFIKTVEAKVVNQYLKKDYWVLRLKNREVTFYITTKDNIKNLLNENIKVNIFTNKITFWGYLTSFYAVSYNLRLLEVFKVEKYIESQHKNEEIINLFKALFLGESMNYKTRKKLGALGISHLMALSGLHLGFISFFLFLMLNFFYKKVHKFFPYRNKWIDIGFIVLIMEFLYLWAVGFPPSLIRAFVLESVLFLVAVSFGNLFSVKALIITGCLSLFLFANKIFGIGFLLSMAGVFYIYLFFNYFKANFYNSILLSFYMFLVMFVWGHYFFGYMSNYQLLSPVVNILFSVFYPLGVCLHLFGMGGVFDEIILKYLALGEKYYYVNISIWFLIFFTLLSIIAIKKKWAFYGINLLAFIVLISSVRI